MYREYFEEFYDFSDTTNYNLNISASGVVFTGINPNLTFNTTKDLSIINTNGLRFQNNYFNVVIPNNPNFTICVIMNLWMNGNFNLFFIAGSVSLNVLSFNKITKELSLITSPGTRTITVPSIFNEKKIVLWITENSGANVIKASISNYSATFQLSTKDGMFYRFMYSKNFYDFDSEQLS